MFKSKISKEEIAELPNISFTGEIVVVESEEMQQEAAAYLSQFRVLGFDTESRAVFRKGVKNQISLLQVSSEEKTFLFRLNKMPLSKSICLLLESEKILKIGVAVKDDIHELQQAGRFAAAGFVDLQHIVSQWDIEDKSLQKITAIVLDGRLSKAQRLSNWNAINFTEAQIIYAATDSWVPLLIYNKLLMTKKPIKIITEPVIEPPKKQADSNMIVHETQIRVRYIDVDQMGYLYHAHYVEYFDVARTELIRSLGISTHKLEELGFMMPVLDVKIKYGSPAHYDDLLTIRTTVRELPRVTVIFYYEVFRGEQRLTTGEVKLAFVHSDTRKPCRMPKLLSELMKPYFDK